METWFHPPNPEMAGETYVEQLVKKGETDGHRTGVSPISMCVDFPLTKSGLDRKFFLMKEEKNIRWLACLLTPKGLAFFLFTFIALNVLYITLYQCLLLAQD
jgi:hypothetical protein